jgi:hypothetical protein
MACASRAGPEGTQETFTASPGHDRAVLRHREARGTEGGMVTDKKIDTWGIGTTARVRVPGLKVINLGYTPRYLKPS